MPRRTRRGFVISGLPHDPTRCARPECCFSPLLTLNESGGLAVSGFCSEACREWLLNAVHNARCALSLKVERQAQRLLLIAELLNLRDHPTDVTFYTTPTEPLGVTHGR